MSARSSCLIIGCVLGLGLAGCIYSGASTVETPGFSSTYFRYQMQAQQQAVVARKQREIAAAFAADQAAARQAAEATAQPAETEVAENTSWWERLKSRFR